MIFTSLTVENFGVFHGRQTVQLVPRPPRSIILFGGKNGAGKSTLFEAIRLCLYGPLALEGRVSKDAYLNYLDGRIHSSPSLLIQPTYASVTLEFQYADVEALHLYTVTRSWERRSSQKIVEQLQVLRDGTPLDELAGEHWQDFVRDLIPLGVSQLFFFDGEKIQQLAEDTSDQQTLAEAIKSLLGLDITERLQTDLSLYLSRLTKASRNNPLASQADELQQEINGVQKEIKELQASREKLQAEAEGLGSDITQIEKEITAEGGTFARNRESLLKQEEKLKTQIDQHEDLIRQLCNGLLPFAIVPRLCSQLKDQLLQEEQQAKIESGQALLKTAQEELQQRLLTDDFWKTLPKVSKAAKEKIHGHFLEALEAPLQLEQAGQIEIVHQLSPPDQRQIFSWIDQATNGYSKPVHESARELENLSRKLHQAKERLRKIPAEDVLNPLLEKLHVQHQALVETSKQTLLIDEKMKVAETRLSGLQRQYGQIAEKLAAQATQASQVKLAQNAQAVLEEYQAKLIEKKVSQLERAVSECFNTLCRKKDALRRMTIDPKGFSVTLYDRKNQPFAKSKLSAGEKQIYAISMLWALAKTSGRPLPIIIDTPLARLDSDHRKLLVEYYFPAASHQVLILSTDTEVDHPYFAALQRDVAHAYHLDFDPVEGSTTAKPGYFWKGTHEAR